MERTRLLLGDEKLGRLRSAHILVVGLGGVGAYAAEMIVRAGAGRLTIADATLGAADSQVNVFAGGSAAQGATSTVKTSDVIMVLDHGRIIERGSHEKLIAEKGVYYQLYTGAFELE